MTPGIEHVPTQITRAELVDLLLGVLEGVREGDTTSGFVSYEASRKGFLVRAAISTRTHGPIIVGEFEPSG
jgi:hypothetical protein